MATKKRVSETTQKDREHILKAYEKRMEDSRDGQHYSYPQWSNPLVDDDQRIKFVMTYWGGPLIASNNKPMDIHVLLKDENGGSCVIFVAGNTECDILSYGSEESEKFKEIIKAFDNIDDVFTWFYNRPVFK
jgi:hypothetical protein